MYQSLRGRACAFDDQPSPTRAISLRTVLILLHRWAGLTIASFLVIAGLTGAVLPYFDDLSHMVAPKLWTAKPPAPGEKPLDGVELMRRVELQTGAVVRYMPLRLDPHFAQAVFVAAPRGSQRMDFDEVIADPYTGAIRQKVRYGRLSDGPVNLMPFVMQLHFSLAAGPFGSFVFGVASLVWVFVCLLGIYLTLPRKSTWSTWFKRWVPAWRVRTDSGFQPLAYDAHRAGGLWLWPALLVFAWSGVAFNLPQVHDPLNRLAGGHGLFTAPRNIDPAIGMPMKPDEAVVRGQALMAEQAAAQGFTIDRGYALTINPRVHAMGYYARTSLDRPIEGTGSTLVWFDAVDGHFLAFQPPFGKTTVDGFDKWIRELHVARVFGLPYQLLVSFTGLATTVLSLTGMILWGRRQMLRARRTKSTPDQHRIITADTGMRHQTTF